MNVKDHPVWKWLTNAERREVLEAEQRRTEPMRFCVHCKYHAKHAEYPHNADLDVCSAPQNLKVHLVSAKVVHRVPAAHILRSHDFGDFCGPRARWFEPKSTPPADAG